MLYFLPLERQPRVLLPNMITPPPATNPPLASPRVQDQILTAQSLNKQTPTIKWTNEQYWHSCSPYSTLEYSTVQYSNMRGGWCHSTFHSVWCQRAGLAVCHQCKKRDRGGGDQLGFGVLTRRYWVLWPHTSISCGGHREALWAPWQVGVI